MAYGLKGINGNYQADGSGRDFFFVGDFTFKNGRKTPDANTKGLKPVPAPSHPRKIAEVDAGNTRKIGAKQTQIQKWAKHHMERGEGFGGQQAAHKEEKARKQREIMEKAMSMPSLDSTIAAASGSLGPAAQKNFKDAELQARVSRKKQPRGDGSLNKSDSWIESTQWSHGAIPGWQPKRYELPKGESNAAIGLPRGACDYDKAAGPGDQTRGIRAAVPHHFADSHKLLKTVAGQGKQFELEFAAENNRAGVDKVDPSIRDKAMRDQTGDFRCGITGDLPHHKSFLSDLGYNQGFVMDERQVPDKYHGLPIFKDSPDLKAKKAQEGDECLGIKTGQPHYRSTSSDLGSIPGWHKSRYSFSSVANANFRLTMWRD